MFLIIIAVNDALNNRDSVHKCCSMEKYSLKLTRIEFSVDSASVLFFILYNRNLTTRFLFFYFAICKSSLCLFTIYICVGEGTASRTSCRLFVKRIKSLHAQRCRRTSFLRFSERNAASTYARTTWTTFS